MSKKIAIFLLGILTLTQLSGCAATKYVSSLFGKTEKIARFVTEDKIARATDVGNFIEVEILDLSKPLSDLIFTKSAIANSKNQAQITPQTSGKVTDIKVKVGSPVKNGTLLITLGNSLSTDIAEIQYQTALTSLEIAANSKAITNDTARRSVQASALGVKTSYESYQTAIKSQNNAEDIYDEQYSNSKSGKSSLKDAKNSAEDNLAKLNDTISTLENQEATLTDTLSKLEPSDPSYEDISKSLEEIQATLAKAKEQKATLEAALKTAENGLDQVDDGLDLLEVSFEAQQDQLEFAVFAGEKQYEIAIKQFEIAANAAELQNLGVQTQVLQLNSAAKIAELSNDQKNIKSPIKGIVTEITATENNFVAPGQVIAKIEDPNTLLIKTGVNTEEAAFLTLQQNVKILQGSKEITGKIISISPSINSYSNKINIEIEAKNTAQITLGSLVKIQIPVKTKQIFIPLNSLYNGTEGQFVKTIDNNKIKYLKVTIGEIIGDSIEIKTGLKGSEKVVITPNTIVEENETVTIKK